MPIQFRCSLLPVLASFCVQYSYYSSIIPWNEKHPNKSWMILSNASHNGELNDLFGKLECNYIIFIINWILFLIYWCLYINFSMFQAKQLSSAAWVKLFKSRMGSGTRWWCLFALFHMGLRDGASTTSGLSMVCFRIWCKFYMLPITYDSARGFCWNLLLATGYLLFRARDLISKVYHWNFNEESFILVSIKLKTIKQPWATQPHNTSLCHFPHLCTTIHHHNNTQLRTNTFTYRSPHQSQPQRKLESTFFLYVQTKRLTQLKPDQRKR